MIIEIVSSDALSERKPLITVVKLEGSILTRLSEESVVLERPCWIKSYYSSSR